MSESSSPDLTDTQVHVWRASLSVSDGVVHSLRSLLSEDELHRASRFSFQELRRHFIVRRGQLRTVLALYLQENPRNLRFDYGPQDKPRLVGKRAWEDLGFNTSHSHGMALLAVAVRRELGIDLEKIRDDMDHTEIASRYFTPAEAAAIAAALPEVRSLLFFDYWTCKEAWVKARGGGLSVPLSRFEIRLVSDDTHAEVVGVDPRDSETKGFVHRLRVAPGFAAALAVTQPDATISLRDWTPRTVGLEGPLKPP